MAPAVSKLWNFFIKKDQKIATCKHCLREVKYSGNTSNLASHLKKNHPSVYETFASPNVKKPISIVIPDDRPSTSSTAASSSTLNIVKSSSQTELNLISPIADAFNRVREYSEGGLRHSKVINCLLYFICKDKRPFYILEGQGFKKLMKELAPSFKIPSAAFMKKQLDLKYDAVAFHFKEKLQKATHISFSMDVWTETMSEKAFFGITAHFLERIDIQSIDLSIVQLQSNHTAECLEQTMLKVFDEWNISKENVVGITTDNGYNIVAAVRRSFEAQHIHCFAHTLNLVTEAALLNEKIVPTIIKVRAIVKYIKNSVNVSDKLRKIQIENNVAEGNIKKMILDVKTRWNSTYYMVQRFLELLKVVGQILIDDASSPEMPSASEVETLRNLETLLKPFEFATTEISGEKYVTMSKIIPMVHCLKNRLENYESNDANILAVRDCLLSAVEKRFGKAEQNSRIAISTILDPRFKTLHFKNPTACAKAIAKLKAMCAGEQSSEESEEDAPTVEAGEPFDFWQTHKELVHGKRKRKQSSGADSSEVTLYLSNPVSPLKSNPLEQWEEMMTIFPGLYKLARQYLLNMATSVPCERLFSKAGATITQDRNRLSGKYLQKLVF